LAQVVAVLTAQDPATTTVYSWQTPGPVDAQVRLLSGGRLQVQALDAASPDFAAATRLILPAEFQAQFPSQNFTVATLTATNPALERSWLGRLVAKASVRRNQPVPACCVAVRIGSSPALAP
jgi:hypothetical protein